MHTFLISYVPCQNLITPNFLWVAKFKPSGLRIMKRLFYHLLAILLSFPSPTLNNSSCLNGTLKVNLYLYFQARIAFLQGERKGQENLKNDLVTFPQDFFSSSLTPTFNKLDCLPVEVFYVSRVEATSNDKT